uniref:Cytochrome c n=1 Tax=Roseihalotalea indica TaxID=2867963 RepID=A0AA49JJ60_9BACT|nr:cytochrome c [Tunicatimonas sp. TK19036]WKN38622.1 cytochrome c [Tunicatimonas sp. TK19036]
MTPFVAFSQSSDWEAPKEADDLQNPLHQNSEATVEGKELYDKMCVICHGKKGKGDGVAGMNLSPRPTNLTSSSVQQQTDGVIYWKITEGRAPMASYKNTLEEEQRWQLVNYIRELGK